MTRGWLRPVFTSLRLFTVFLVLPSAHGEIPRIASARTQQFAPQMGLDHVVIAVNDLERAAERYRALGFSLKPGRPHSNGIRNFHAKFPDGTELELLTAPEARDPELLKKLDAVAGRVLNG